ncbi:RNA polymerase sigma factor [Armatimonas rosea]|uniref:RNA polymerase sigma-70 factor (ECF subfamily) n=1 Tax=Armatimonas rosea TaxID=685828 RepID=A0A7W9SRL6_ARMRO|nr:sigma-70 family RNA polymerase sigma factor [Armatimonas rosea]MBB6050788.1 RNA polymerase sigma-70 factor (ECF subfamily) [Armatimonas rosea]
MQATLTSLSTQSVDALLLQSQNGCLSARHELVGRYRSVIQATASRMSSSRADAEDLAADIYLHVFGVINSCSNTQTLPGWIKRVAINEVYQSWRRKKRQPQQLSLDSVLESCGEGILRGDESENPATILIERTEKIALSERLARALQSLPAHQRLLCELYYDQSRSFEQISHETGLAMGTIKSRLFRARASMHRKMGDLSLA